MSKTLVGEGGILFFGKISCSGGKQIYWCSFHTCLFVVLLGGNNKYLSARSKFVGGQNHVLYFSYFVSGANTQKFLNDNWYSGCVPRFDSFVAKTRGVVAGAQRLRALDDNAPTKRNGM